MSANPELDAAKAALRAIMRAGLAGMPAAERAAASARICSRLEEQEVWKNARAVLIYAPVGVEPDVWPLLPVALAEGKMVALPRFMAETGHYEAALIDDPGAHLRAGRFGIREPVAGRPGIPLNRLDLILVPGIAFDTAGWRLGRGGGFYDRLLAADHGLTCGVAFDAQIVSQVPAGSHDVCLNCIVTPTRWHRISPGARF